jgi:hypothetical protein
MKTWALVLFTLWMAGPASSAQTVLIRLADYSGLSIKQTTQLAETVDLVFAHSGFRVVWQHCVGGLALLSGTSCKSEMQANEIAVDLVADQPGSSHSWTLPMGHAIVTDRGGQDTTVFVPAVGAQAAGFGIAFERLLGYTVAHEIGHCLLGPGHSYTGLMRGSWNRKDAVQISRLSLHLTKQENRKAVARLTLAESAAQR